MSIGYAFVREHLGLSAFPPPLPARIQPVTRVPAVAAHLANPARNPPDPRDVLGPPPLPARIQPVTRVQAMADHLAIPARIAPDTRDVLVHLLFALKHEGVDLGILMEALPHIPPARMLDEIRATPGGAYIRTACYL